MATGSSGKTYSKDAYGNITVKHPDGRVTTAKTSDAVYKSTVNAMHKDGVQNIGVSSGSSSTPAKKPAAPATPTVDKQAAQSGMNNAFAGLDKFVTAGTNTGNGLVDPSTGSNLGFNGGYKYVADGGYDKLYNDLVSGNVMSNEQYAGQQAALAQQEALLAAQAQAEAALKAQINSSVAGMQANEGKINQGYEDLARQAFIQAKVGQNNLTENLAINGINGGATESAVLGIENQYQQSLAGIGQDKQNALNQLQTDIAQVKASGNAQLAQTMSDYYMKLADASIAADNENYNRLMNSLNMAMQQSQLTGVFNGSPTMQAQQIAYEQALKQQQMGMAKDDYVNDQQSRARDSAYTEIELYGKVISQSIIKAIGGQAIADQMASSYKSQLAYMKSLNKKSSSGGGSDEDVAASATPTETQSPSALKSTNTALNSGAKFSAPVGWNLNVKSAVEQYNAGKITYGELQKKLQAYGYSSAQLSS